MASQEHIKLAQSLPPRLLRFFARYPPSPSFRSLALKTTSPTSPLHPNARIRKPPPPFPNPFQSHKHPATGKWHGPVFSLRRQADLVKLARYNGVEELLPHTVKATQYRLWKREKKGLRVKGTGVGQRVKGKKWERTMKGRLETRRQAMLGMPKLVQQWKQLGHGRGWKKWPK